MASDVHSIVAVEHSVADAASMWGDSLVAPLRTRHANVAVAGQDETKAANVAFIAAGGKLQQPSAEQRQRRARTPQSAASPFPGGADIHGPYQHGGIFPARNGGGGMFDPPLVVDVQPVILILKYVDFLNVYLWSIDSSVCCVCVRAH